MLAIPTNHFSNLPIRYHISAPPEMFIQGGSDVPGAAASADSALQTLMGLNVLLHGVGGASFVDYPNQPVQNNLMGVVVLAPDDNLFWGGEDNGLTG